MNCLRCGSPMYAVAGADGNRATCSGCSQYVDCARCSSPTCGDTKCLMCYNKARAPKVSVPKKRSAPIVPEDQEL